MIETKISLLGLDAITRKLASLEQFARVVEPAMREGGEFIVQEARNQPPKKAGAFSALATDGQRRAYWAKVRSGEAQHGQSGYVRSGALKEGWTQPEVRRTGNGVQVVVKNEARHAPWVHSQVYQQPFHKASGFPTEAQLIEKAAPKILDGVREAVRRELAK